jgi:hypothetical protein
VLPEAQVALSYDLTPRIRLLASYSVLFLSDVVRPSDAIDPTVNRSLLPSSQVFNPFSHGPARPGISFGNDTFWANGGSLGVSVSY